MTKIDIVPQFPVTSAGNVNAMALAMLALAAVPNAGTRVFVPEPADAKVIAVPPGVVATVMVLAEPPTTKYGVFAVNGTGRAPPLLLNATIVPTGNVVVPPVTVMVVVPFVAVIVRIVFENCTLAYPLDPMVGSPVITPTAVQLVASPRNRVVGGVSDPPPRMKARTLFARYVVMLGALAIFDQLLVMLEGRAIALFPVPFKPAVFVDSGFVAISPEPIPGDATI